MFSGLFHKGSGDKKPPKDGTDARGLEVVEDDPDTAWSKWDHALAAQDSSVLSEDTTPLPLVPEPDPPVVDEPTQPMPLEEKTPQQRKNDALDVVDLHHHRIANTIRTMWGYKECSVYINKLIMSGGDGMGKSRIGFNQQAVAAMLVLADLHDAEFGTFGDDGNLGFADPTVRVGIEGSRRG